MATKIGMVSLGCAKKQSRRRNASLYFKARGL